MKKFRPGYINFTFIFLISFTCLNAIQQNSAYLKTLTKPHFRNLIIVTTRVKSAIINCPDKNAVLASYWRLIENDASDDDLFCLMSWEQHKNVILSLQKDLNESIDMCLKHLLHSIDKFGVQFIKNTIKHLSNTLKARKTKCPTWQDVKEVEAIMNPN